MKNSLILLLFGLCFVKIEAQTYFTKEAQLSFYSHTPLEEIEAINEKAVSIFNIDEASIQFSVLMKGFHFKNALMQTHFNENYIESDTYPKGTFTSSSMDLSSFQIDKDGEYTIPVTGTLTIRDREKEISTNAKITVTNGKIAGTASFVVSPADFEIEIPAIVKGKIAKEIEVKVQANYELYEKS